MRRGLESQRTSIVQLLGVAPRQPWMRGSAGPPRSICAAVRFRTLAAKAGEARPGGSTGTTAFLESAPMHVNPAAAPASYEPDVDEHGLSNSDREAIRRVVDQAPPLSTAQRERLAAVLGGGARRREREPVAA